MAHAASAAAAGADKRKIKLVVGGEIYQRKAATWAEAQQAVRDITNAMTAAGGVQSHQYTAHYEDRDGDHIVVKSEEDWECFVESFPPGEGPSPKLYLRVAPESAQARRVAIDVDPRLAAKFQQFQLQFNHSNDKLMQFLFSRVEPGGASTIARLPKEMLGHCLVFLPSLEMRALCGVCHHWRTMLRTSDALQSCITTCGLYVVGGINHSQTETARAQTLGTVVKFSPLQRSWATSCSMSVERYHCGTALVDRKIYVVGGRNATQRLSSAEVYDPAVNEWRDLPPMRSVRSAPACAVHRGYLYVFGGFDGETEFSSVERFSPHLNQWTPPDVLKPMPYEACELGAASLGERVYVIGGTQSRHSPEEKVLAIVQEYDPAVNEWTVLPHMRTKRMCPAAVAYQGRLWVMGGSDGHTALNTVECYNPKTGGWEDGPPLHVSRSNATAAVMNGRIYLTGGFCASEGGPLASVERYDTRSGWVQVKSMPEKRDACKVLTWE
eukprot:TRINITY_DN3940_c0_g2_i1.p1 TRINITY_DN3940_c0_g2~~TRINITY_DN3940_c0_g2_i1.p1  ORF type:complete len:496 (+),score=160.55 TRINITY_DN3940_c0_g2_i1:83-1570(+)